MSQISLIIHDTQSYSFLLFNTNLNTILIFIFLTLSKAGNCVYFTMLNKGKNLIENQLINNSQDKQSR